MSLPMHLVQAQHSCRRLLATDLAPPGPFNVIRDFDMPSACVLVRKTCAPGPLPVNASRTLATLVKYKLYLFVTIKTTKGRNLLQQMF